MKAALTDLVIKSFQAMYPRTHIELRSYSKTEVTVVVQGGVNWSRSYTLHSREGTAMVFRLESDRDVFVSIPYRKVA